MMLSNETACKRRNKKTRFYLLLLLLTVLSLAACGGGGGGGGDPDPGSNIDPDPITNPIPNPTPSPSPGPTPLPGGGTSTTAPVWSGGTAIINTATTDTVYETQLVYDDQGDGIAVWVSRDTNNVNRLVYSRYSANADTWSTPQLIDDTPMIIAQLGPGHEYRVQRVSLAIDDDTSNAYVVWFVTDTSGLGKVMASTYNSTSSTWSTPVVLNNDEMADARAVSVSSNGGVTIATWLEVDNQSTGTFPEDLYGVYASVASGSNWGTAEKIDDGTQVAYTARIEGHIPPIAVIDFNGNATVVYNYFTTGWTIWAAEKPANGTWQTPVQIDGGGNVSHRDISAAVTEDGSFHAVWVDYIGSLDQAVMYSRKAAGALTWSTPVMVESEAGNAFAPVFAGNANGDGIVAWVNDETSTDLMVSHYDTTLGAWGSAVAVGNGVSDSRQPQVIMDPMGNAVVVWRWINLWYSFYTPADGWTDIASVPGGRHGMHYEFAWRGGFDSLALIWAYNESGVPSEVNVGTLQ
ncbi:hypothetical protein [Kaarinaea lacus]